MREPRTPPVEALDDFAVFLVRQLTAVREVSFSAVATLSTLDRTGSCRITELARRERLSQPSVTAMISRLERQGLVRRGHDPTDGRIVLVSITDEGRAMLRRRRASRLAFLASLIEALDPAERRALADAAPVLCKMTDPARVPAALDAARAAAATGAPRQ